MDFSSFLCHNLFDYCGRNETNRRTMKVLSAALFALCVATTHALAAIKAGNKLPQATLFWNFGPPVKINVAEYAAGKNMLIVGLPGAFTPTCSNVQVPGYLQNQDALKAAGVDEVLVFCVNDSAVMKAWEADQGIKGSMITFMGDPLGEFTKACGMELIHPATESAGLVGRCKRFAMYVESNVVKYVAVSEAEDDPAGDKDPSATRHDAMLEAISMQKQKV
jgi:peroxiredoxin